MTERVRSYLRADEKLLWTGRPQQGLRFVAADIFIVPFSLLWAGFALTAVFGSGMALAEAPFPFVLFPLIFGVASVYITVGRLIHDAWLRSRIEYALTDRRVLIVQRVFGEDLTALDLGRLETVKLKGRSGGRGDLIFGQEPGLFGFGRRSFRASFALWTPSLGETPAFLGVENARRLFDQIEGRRAGSRA